MSGGQQEAARAAKAWSACDAAQDALDTLFGETAAMDIICGPHPNILAELNRTLKKYKLQITKTNKP